MNIHSAAGVLAVVWGVLLASWLVIAFVLILRSLVVSLSNHLPAVLRRAATRHTNQSPSSRKRGPGGVP